MKGVNFFFYVVGTACIVAGILAFSVWLRDFIDEILYQKDRRKKEREKTIKDELRKYK